jgi:hypothetical protein
MKLNQEEMRYLKVWFAEKGSQEENEHVESELEAVEDALAKLIKKLKD